MRRLTVLYLTALLMFVMLGCGCGGDGPVIPGAGDPGSDFIIKVDVGGVTYKITDDMSQDELLNLILLLIADRSAQQDPMPPDWIPDGTLMTHEELCVFFAVMIMEGIYTPPEYQCLIYSMFHDLFKAGGPAFTGWCVMLFEFQGWDIPDYLEVEPPC